MQERMNPTCAEVSGNGHFMLILWVLPSSYFRGNNIYSKSRNLLLQRLNIKMYRFFYFTFCFNFM